MSVDHIRYDLLTQEALRSVIRTVLTDAAVKGLPGDHHFFITFDTRADGVRISARLKASYPQDMTIVLQHQFWDLAVGDEDFEVGLAFGGVTELITVPFDAVTAFFDPAVQFGFQFETIEGTASAEADSGAQPAEKPASVTARSVAEENKPEALPALPEAETPVPDQGSGGEVVRLDRFRKK